MSLKKTLKGNWYDELDVPGRFCNKTKQGGKAKLWGRADAGASVTVSFKNAQSATKAGHNGKRTYENHLFIFFQIEKYGKLYGSFSTKIVGSKKVGKIA